MRVEQKVTNWTSTNVHLLFGQTVLIWALKVNSSGGKVSSISIKTGSIQKAESDCKAVMEICDVERNCCQTSVDGRGLDNPGLDRQRGKTDVYTTPSLLGNCAQEVININECIHTANKHFVYQIQTVWLHICIHQQCFIIRELWPVTQFLPSWPPAGTMVLTLLKRISSGFIRLVCRGNMDQDEHWRSFLLSCGWMAWQWCKSSWAWIQEG